MTRDDAVIGEAAGIAMGLVMIGTRSPLALEDMTNVRAPLPSTPLPSPPLPPHSEFSNIVLFSQYARDTQHEKIQRGLALGISMVSYQVWSLVFTILYM